MEDQRTKDERMFDAIGRPLGENEEELQGNGYLVVDLQAIVAPFLSGRREG